MAPSLKLLFVWFPKVLREEGPGSSLFAYLEFSEHSFSLWPEDCIETQSSNSTGVPGQLQHQLLIHLLHRSWAPAVLKTEKTLPLWLHLIFQLLSCQGWSSHPLKSKKMMEFIYLHNTHLLRTNLVNHVWGLLYDTLGMQNPSCPLPSRSLCQTKSTLFSQSFSYFFSL